MSLRLSAVSRKYEKPLEITPIKWLRYRMYRSLGFLIIILLINRVKFAVHRYLFVEEEEYFALIAFIEWASFYL